MKKQFGYGYKLTLKFNKPFELVKQQVHNHLRETVGDEAKLISTEERQATFLIPMEKSNTFELLFERLDNPQTKQEIDLEIYDLAVSTLEDVFLKISAQQPNSLDENDEDF